MSWVEEMKRSSKAFAEEHKYKTLELYFEYNEEEDDNILTGVNMTYDEVVNAYPFINAIYIFNVPLANIVRQSVSITIDTVNKRLQIYFINNGVSFNILLDSNMNKI